jgi:hypothetical protein
MSIERFANIGDAGGDKEGTFLEQFQQAIVMENLEQFAACMDRLFRAADQQKDTSDAWNAVFASAKSLSEYHTPELLAWSEKEPELRRLFRQFVIFLDKVFDLGVELYEEDDD